MSDEKLVCFVCKKSGDDLVIFSEETFKKCKNILKLRKIHNLKYKDIILPVEYIDSGYHRGCYKAFTGLMKKYFSSEPLSAEKKKGNKNQQSCAVTGNSSPTSSSTLELSSVPIDLQSPSTEFITKSQQILPSQSIETQPSTSQDESYLQSVATESSTISQLTPISESIGVQSSTLQGNSDSSQPDVSNNNIVTQDENISADNIAGSNDNEVVCIFCDRKKKKLKSKMLPLHAADVHEFKASVNSKIEGHEEYKDFLNKLNNFPGLKFFYHTKCRVSFHNKLSSLKAQPNKTEWHYQRQYHQIVFNEISTIINEDVIKKGRCFLLTHLHDLYIDSLQKMLEENKIS